MTGEVLFVLLPGDYGRPPGHEFTQPVGAVHATHEAAEAARKRNADRFAALYHDAAPEQQVRACEVLGTLPEGHRETWFVRLRLGSQP